MKNAWNRFKSFCTVVLFICAAWTAYANFIPPVRNLGQAMYFEAGNESWRGKLAVAGVILNQINDPQYPKTVVSVIMAGHERGIHCDFSYTCDGLGEGLDHWDSWFKQQELFALAGIILGVYYSTGHYYDPTGGALTYQAVAGADTGWFGLFDKCAVIGGHKFYWKKKTTAITATSSP